MNKENFLQKSSTQNSENNIDRDKIFSRSASMSPENFQIDTKGSKKVSRFSVTNILYIVGTVIVIIGITIFIGQIWKDMNSLGHIMITLGLGLLIAAIGSILLKQKPENSVGAVFHFIGGALIPGGAMVMLQEINMLTIWPIVIAFGGIFICYLLLSIMHKNPVLIFFAILNGTIFIYLFVGALVSQDLQYELLFRPLWKYLTMAIGATYLLLAYIFRNEWNKILFGLLCFFGSFWFFSSAFSFLYYSVLWQLLYFVMLIGGLVLSVYIQSRIVLAVSTLFLISHVSFISYRYFVNSLGWPILLIILGFAFIGFSYASVAINKKYFKRS